MRLRGFGCLLMAGSVLTSACAGGRTAGEERRVLVQPGMTAEEVRKAIGGPERTHRLDVVSGVQDQTVEVWSYVYATPPNAAEVTLEVVAAALVVVALAAGFRGGGGGGKSDPKWRFVVGFGPDGRVRGVSNLEKVK